MNKKAIGFFFVIVILLLSIWGTVFYRNASIEKVLEKEGAIRVLEQIDTGNSILVIYDAGDFIRGEELRKGLLGWRVTKRSQATNDRGDDIVFRPDNLSIISTDNLSIHYGYVNQGEVDYIRFQSDLFDIKHKVQSYYWYIPVVGEDQGVFDADQFSIILKDGSEVYYPFKELQ